MTNIIGDIAGRFDELELLIKQMPPGEVISVGDMIDRHDQSKEVIEFFMQPNRRAILGNHEHMMLDYLNDETFYTPPGSSGGHPWLWNGGRATLDSYRHLVPREHLEWIRALPLYIEIGHTLISHSFIRRSYSDEESLKYSCDFGNDIYDKGETTIIWNRDKPRRGDKYKLQVIGHNSRLQEFRDKEGLYAICLDDSRNKKLTGLHLESLEVFQQDYLF